MSTHHGSRSRGHIFILRDWTTGNLGRLFAFNIGIKLGARFVKTFSVVVLCSLLSQAGHAMNEPELNKRLTHILYELVLGDYFLEGDKKYRPNYINKKAYLYNFITDWSLLIRNPKFETTKDIFNYYKSDQTKFLGKHYYYWEGLYDHESDYFVNLGGHTNTYLKIILDSETQFESIHNRIEYLLEKAVIHLLYNSQKYIIAKILHDSFSHYDYGKINNHSKNLEAGIPFSQNSQKAKALFGLLSLGAGLNKIAGKPLNSLASLSRPNFLKASNYTSMQLAATKSAGLHAAIGEAILYDHLSGRNKSPQKISVDSDLETNLLNSFQKLYMHSGSILNLVKIAFNGNFELQTKNIGPRKSHQLIEEYLAKPNTQKKHLFELFLGLEKYLVSSMRNNSTNSSMELVLNTYNEIKNNIDKSLVNGFLDLENIEVFRKNIINGVAQNYKRDFPNVSDMFLGWGGNCVAQTILFTSLLEHYSHLLPRDIKIGIAVNPTHIETVLIGKKNIYYMISGQKHEKTKDTLYGTDFLVHLAGRNFPHLRKQLRNQKLRPNAILKESDKKAISIPNDGDQAIDDYIKNMNSNFFDAKNNLLKLFKPNSREGTLEHIEWSDFDLSKNDTDEVEDLLHDGSTPETAKITYRSFHSNKLSSQERSSLTQSFTMDQKNQASDYKNGVKLEYARIEDYSNDFTLFMFNDRSGTSHPLDKHLIVYNKELYLQLLDLQQRETNTSVEKTAVRLEFDKTLYSYIDSYHQRYLDTLFYTATIAPSENINNLLKLDNSMIDLYEKSFWMFNVEYKKIFSNLWALEFDKSNLEEKYRQTNHYETELFQKVIEAPLKFLKIYDEADSKLRKHLLYRFIGDSSLTPFYGATFHWTIRRDHQELSMKLRHELQINLSSLKLEDINIKKDIKKSLAYCNKTPYINTPKSGPEWPWAYSLSKTNCNTKLKKNKFIENNEHPKTGNSSSSTQKLELKASTIIELTAIEVLGFHLWSEEVVDYFIQNDFKYSDSVKNSLRDLSNYQSNSQTHTNTKAFQKLQTYFTTQ